MSFVSIITPTHNSISFIEDTIQSVLKQSFFDWEMIIVDDFSTDNTVELINSFVKHDPRIKLIQLAENSGAAIARNIAIEAAQGRYIAFLDSDDLWLPNKLEKQLAFMQENNYAFTFSAYDKINENGHVFGSIGVPNKVSYFDLLTTNYIGCLTVIYDTSYFGKIHMSTLSKREDFATWLNMLKKVDFAFGLNEPLAKYRVYQGQSSSKKINMAYETWKLYREVERISMIESLYYFSHYAFFGLLRTKYPRLAKFLGIMK
jgi:glycosyltransferase involved in cell wall biosynthesis